MGYESNQVQNPAMVFFYGIYFAIGFMFIFGLAILAYEIYNELVIWEPPFSDYEFYMLTHPLHINIPDIDKLLYCFLFLWLGWSIPMYFMAKKNHAKIQNDTKAKEEQIKQIQNKIERLERIIEEIKSSDINV